jgi:hypothetical protein
MGPVVVLTGSSNRYSVAGHGRFDGERDGASHSEIPPGVRVLAQGDSGELAESVYAS